MNKDEELKKLREEEQLLLSQLKGLQQQSDELNNKPEQQDQKEYIDNVIAARRGALNEVKEEIKTLEGKEISLEDDKKLGWKDYVQIGVEGTLAVAGVAGHYLDHKADVEHLMKMRPGHEIVIENPSKDLMTPEQMIAKIKQDFEGKMVEGYEAGRPEKNVEKPEKDAAKEWENDIKAKEAVLQQEQDRKLQTLEQNKVMQESQLKDAKKDGYEDKLKELDKVIDKEKERIEANFKKEMEPIEKEKQALQKAIDSTKDMEKNERNQEIERQRKEFERQQELERQKQNELTRH